MSDMMRRLVIVTLAMLGVSCGDPSTRAASSTAASGFTGDDIQVRGTLAEAAPRAERLLVFAYTSPVGHAVPNAGEPTSLSNIAPDRSFLLSGVPPGDATIMFLIDAKNDGVIDPGDSVATLDDPDHALAGLKPGDEVVIEDVTIPPSQGKAIATSIAVKRAAPAESAPASPPAP